MLVYRLSLLCIFSKGPGLNQIQVNISCMVSVIRLENGRIQMSHHLKTGSIYEIRTSHEMMLLTRSNKKENYKGIWNKMYVTNEGSKFNQSKQLNQFQFVLAFRLNG